MELGQTDDLRKRELSRNDFSSMRSGSWLYWTQSHVPMSHERRRHGKEHQQRSSPACWAGFTLELATEYAVAGVNVSDRSGGLRQAADRSEIDSKVKIVPVYCTSDDSPQNAAWRRLSILTCEGYHATGGGG